jgi:MFS family permease
VFVSVYFAGIIIGLPITSYCNDRFGRKRSIQLGAFIGIVAGIMQSTPTQVGAFIVGRILGGMASGISLLSVNVYQAEIAPADVRGTMVGFQFFTLRAAGTLGAWMGCACSFSSSMEFAW